MQDWKAGLHEGLGMGSAFIMLNLPLAIVYTYYPLSRQWSLMAVLAVPALVLPAMCAVARLFRRRTSLTVMAASCSLGGVLAAFGNHLSFVVLAHLGIFLGDRAGFSRLPHALQSELNFWKKLFAEQQGYWLPNFRDVGEMVLMFLMVAALTAGWLVSRQRFRARNQEAELPSGGSGATHPPVSPIGRWEASPPR